MRRSLIPILLAKPTWLPRVSGVAASIYADFANGRYWAANARQGDLSAWLAHLGGAFTRADASTCATYTGSDGLLHLAAANVPRFDYNPVTLAFKGILLEGASANYLSYSNTLSNAVWSESGTTTVTQNATGPDGLTSAWTITLNEYDVGTGHINTTLPSANTTSTLSAWLKGTAGQTVSMLVSNAVDQQFTHQFTLPTTLTRVSMTQTHNATPGALSASLYRASATVDTASSVIAYGFDLEGVSSASSYIPTTTAAVTRAADALAITIPPGVGHITYTFDDASTQTVAVSPGAYTIPTTLNRPTISSLVSAA
jgi:hypothetical protein